MKNFCVLFLIVLCSCGSGVWTTQSLPPEKAYIASHEADFTTGASSFTSTLRKLKFAEQVTIIGQRLDRFEIVSNTDTGYVDKASVLDIPHFDLYTKLIAQKLEFKLPSSESNMAWLRASKFIEQYSHMKLQIATDLMLSTYKGTGLDRYGFQVVRLPMYDSVQFTVECTTETDQNYALQKAHAAAYYIATGTEMGYFVDNRIP